MAERRNVKILTGILTVMTIIQLAGNMIINVYSIKKNSNERNKEEIRSLVSDEVAKQNEAFISEVKLALNSMEIITKKNSELIEAQELNINKLTNVVKEVKLMSETNKLIAEEGKLVALLNEDRENDRRKSVLLKQASKIEHEKDKLLSMSEMEKLKFESDIKPIDILDCIQYYGEFDNETKSGLLSYYRIIDEYYKKNIL